MEERAHCKDCGEDLLIAFSCKTRVACPSCNIRRMVQPHRRAERSAADLSLPRTVTVGDVRPNSRDRSDPSGTGVRLRPACELV